MPECSPRAAPPTFCIPHGPVHDGLLSERKRGDIWRAAALDHAGAWLAVQVAEPAFRFLNIPEALCATS